MKNEVLIFRTDRVGDLLITFPAITSLKEKIKDCSITFVGSSKNVEYAKDFKLFDEILTYPTDSLIKRINFIYQLSKRKFDHVIVLDGKDRSIIASLFVKSNSKIAIFSSKKNSFFYKLFKINLIDDDEKTDLIKIFQSAMDQLNLYIQINKFDFLLKKENNNFSSNIPLKNYLHLHFDEKWSNKHYIESYTSINPTYSEFVKFLEEITEKGINIVITTGLVDFDLLTEIKDKFFSKKSEKIYHKNFSNASIYLIYKPSIEDFESISRQSKIFASCHCGLTHIPNSFNIKIIDIIEKNKKEWYGRYTLYLKNYNQIYRNKFSILSEDLKKLMS